MCVELSNDDWHECILEICRMNQIELFQWIYSIRKEQIDTNIEEYFLASLQNGYNQYSLYRCMYIICNINFTNFTNDLFYEAFNYGNKKAVMWLFTIGEQVDNKFKLLKLCDFTDLQFYSQFVDIDETLGRNLILDKIKYCMDGYDNEITFLLNLHKYDFSNYAHDIYKSRLPKDNPIYQTLMSTISSDSLPVATLVENNNEAFAINAFEEPVIETDSTWQTVTTYFATQGLRRRYTNL